MHIPSLGRILWFFALAVPSQVLLASEVRFGRDILPILSENCFACHGPDESNRQADLRLDTREAALAVLSLESPEESELLARVTAEDADLLMPPESSHKKPLTSEQVDLLKRWINEGAPWGKHWSFEPPTKAALPLDAKNPIDAFVVARLQKANLALSPAATKQTLLRRLSLDLTGLPPTYKEVQVFEVSNDEQAYEAAVDRLLASEHFGERMAMWWLDAARYSDTDGFQQDASRTNWPWRDWVVKAFNRNMPFDQFTIEQFAGDLLPDATPEQKLATCFHRNHMTNGEGGRDSEESRIDYVIDRVNTTGTVWLGLTLGCCQCHSHKYDPITQADYYSLNAFFNSIDEDGKAGNNAKPYLKYKSSYVDRAIQEAEQLVQEREQALDESRRAAEAPFEEWLAEQFRELRPGFRAWQPIVSARCESLEGTEFEQGTDGTIRAVGPNPNQDDYRIVTSAAPSRITGIRLEVLPSPNNTQGGLARGADGHFVLTDVKLQVRSQTDYQIRDILLSSAIASHSDNPKKHKGYGDIAHVLDDDPRNGWSTSEVKEPVPQAAIFTLEEPLVLAANEELIFEMRHRSTRGDANIGCFRISLTDQRGPALKSLETAPLEELAHRDADKASLLENSLRSRLREQFLADYAPFVAVQKEYDRADRQLAEARQAKQVDVMVLQERKKPRDTHILVRGVWDNKGEKVSPNVPAAIVPWVDSQPKNRLGLARWIVSAENPLTARVVVNHVWQMLFGAGLVRTPEDFGLLGEHPTHPELLDWLAVDFVEHHWDLKRLIRLIVTSDTYRQRSEVSAELLAIDPDNRLLARGARFRLPSWMLRDAALKSSGLLNPALGGPPVKPYQSPGVWEEMFMGRFKYEPSEGPAQYRRTVYAFWRRAIAPTFLFDSAQRRVCEVRESRTNTPLHALTLLNDANYLAASRALADSSLRQIKEPAARIEFIVQNVLSRKPDAQEQSILQREYDRALAYYTGHADQATLLLQELSFQTTSSVDLSDHAAERAALTLVASMALNLDAALNHE